MSAANAATVVAIIAVMSAVLAYFVYRTIETIALLRASKDRAEDMVSFLLERNADLWTQLTEDDLP